MSLHLAEIPKNGFNFVFGHGFIRRQDGADHVERFCFHVVFSFRTRVVDASTIAEALKRIREKRKYLYLYRENGNPHNIHLFAENMSVALDFIEKWHYSIARAIKAPVLRDSRFPEKRVQNKATSSWQMRESIRTEVYRVLKIM